MSLDGEEVGTDAWSEALRRGSAAGSTETPEEAASWGSFRGNEAHSTQHATHRAGTEKSAKSVNKQKDTGESKHPRPR